MNAKETGMVLEMITAHYWQTPKTAERNAELMVRTWQKALADIPLQPHIELALDDWFKHEKWPPQVAELRERALKLGGPTPAQIAEADAWRAREEFAQFQVADEWDERCAKGGCDEEDYWTFKSLRVDEFWREKRAELGLPPTEPLNLGDDDYQIKLRHGLALPATL